MSTNFNKTERDTLYKVIRARRDMRHFLPHSKIDDEVLERILLAGHSSPSVGMMQPWRFIRITNQLVRKNIITLVEEERQYTANLFDKKKQEFLKLKVEGIENCAELIAVVQAPDDGTIFGRRTLPEEMALCSTACAIQNMWLASRSENIGMGWVSFFDPIKLATLLNCPSDSKPVALLCLGPVKEFYPEPMLQLKGWRTTKELSSMVFENQWENK
ncbi:Cobalamin biosynthesis protein BluB @ 5,6-dimethylbenzimidazole synthase, flavin destructase family [hydrothermal vent metagenome]|uniref:Cobalamin biosynthesis protein BluB @ 5,6-dimethylbenzimidazole synthase, flavin destructase family n=1 Tax=hydrothermal vent metagenome TaxID=652676 RepID=A0A3B1AXJ7_9ZZZZ